MKTKKSGSINLQRREDNYLTFSSKGNNYQSVKINICRIHKKNMVKYGKKGNLPLDKATVESLVSIVYKIPSYRISDLEISEIFEPK